MLNYVDGLTTRRSRLLAMRLAVRMEECLEDLYDAWRRQFAGQPLGETCAHLKEAASLRIERVIATDPNATREPAPVDILRLIRDGLGRVREIQLKASFAAPEVVGLVRELESAPANAALDWLVGTPEAQARRVEQPCVFTTPEVRPRLTDLPGVD